MTHTKFSNQQRQTLAGPRSRQAVPTAQRAVSLACTPHASQAAQRGSGPRLSQSLATPAVAACQTAGGGAGEPQPLAPALGLPPWSAPPQAETLPWATSPPLLGQAPPSSGRLTIAAVSELAVLGNLQFGGVGGGDAVTGLHAVPLFQLRQGAHEAGVGGIQGGNALLL